ncbi:MAG: PilZ domain-containing protein [Planctomycetes bacterium]|nr:PilZ domain-containing protein [Planctomycetota bacterium]
MSNANRRASHRFRLREAFAVLRLEGEGDGASPANRVAKVTDISFSGATVVGWSAVRTGDPLRLTVNLPFLRLECSADVVWTRTFAGAGPLGNRTWVAGVRFRGLPIESRVQIERLAANPLLAIAALGKGLLARAGRAAASAAGPGPVLSPAIA